MKKTVRIMMILTMILGLNLGSTSIFAKEDTTRVIDKYVNNGYYYEIDTETLQYSQSLDTITYDIRIDTQLTTDEKLNTIEDYGVTVQGFNSGNIATEHGSGELDKLVAGEWINVRIGNLLGSNIITSYTDDVEVRFHLRENNLLISNITLGTYNISDIMVA